MEPNKSAANWRWPVLLGIPLLILAICTLGVIYLMPATTELTMRQGNPVKPSVTVIVQVPSSSRDDFFSKLRSYAADKKFVISIKPNLQFKETFDVDLTRGDIWIIGDNLFDPMTFKLGFYLVPPSTAGTSIATETAQDLVRWLSALNAATVTLQ